jgi:DNA repair protein RecN (Recombination protein N)
VALLTSLNIQGLAIIESLAIEFGRGFNVITGETGAGKSILIKALGFLLGAKATAEHVRSGRDAATVSGQFLVPRTHRAVAVLDRLGIPVEDFGDEQKTRLIIRRQVTSKGRSQAWLNDVPVTLTAMKELAEALV